MVKNILKATGILFVMLTVVLPGIFCAISLGNVWETKEEPSNEKTRFDSTIPPVILFPYRKNELFRVVTYMVHYPPGAENKSFEVKAKVIFMNANPGADTFIEIMGGDFHQNGSYSNGTGWWVKMKLYGEKNNTLIKDFGYVATRTTPIPLDPTKNYRMEITIRTPPHLVREYHYMAQFNIYGIENKTTREVSGHVTQTPGASFHIEIVPTLSYYIKGIVYDVNGKGAKGAKLTIINDRSKEKVEIETGDDGTFQYNLADLMGGYQDGDKIIVKAKKGKATGENYTLVDIPSEGYVEEEFSSVVNIYLKKPKEQEFPVLYVTIGIVILVLVLVVYAILMKKKKPSEEEEKREGKEEGEEG